MQEIFNKIQVHVPFRLLRETLLPRVIREGMNPEIGFDHNDLDHFGAADFREVANRLADAGRSVTFHAPFVDLRPGALDPRIRGATFDRLRQVFDLIPCFRPRAVVCHPCFDERYYLSAEAEWLEHSLETWRGLLDCMGGTDTFVALENVYEREPGQMRPLFEGLASPQVRFCFDAGHAAVFGGTAFDCWLESLGPLLGEMHLHDNRGAVDEHLPVGEGSIPFPEIFSWIRQKGMHPILTIESHSEKDLLKTIANIGMLNLLEGL